MTPFAQSMWDADTASQNLGMALLAADPGHAVLTMTIRADMVNGHGIAHGGFIFTLADSAFAFACNAAGAASVAANCQITYLAPAAEGETLTATATEIVRKGRQGITDVTVTRADGTLIAAFRGHSRTIKPS
ncbi:MAG: hydroxyphenylacetyl-CoA thioesterase PaaI [Pseudomonadota bacterium]